MSIQNGNCGKCNKETTAVWAANPPEKNLLLCPECFGEIRKKQSGVNFPYSIFLGKPIIRDGVWFDQPSTNFPTISHFLELCVGKVAARSEDLITTDHVTLDEILVRLYDFVTDPTEVPYWRLKIENAQKISDGMPLRSKERSLALNGDIRFWRWRIEQALLPGSSVVAAKQLLLLQHLRDCVAAWKSQLPLPKTPATIVEVNWELLEPDGTGMWERIVGYHKQLKNSYAGAIDESRLKLLYDQGPDMIFVGRSKFDGYVVFVFTRGDVAFLDSAFLGNALYAMKASEWRELSKLSKSELMFGRHDGVTRVIHCSGWRSRLRRLFRIYNLVLVETQSKHSNEVT